MGIFKFGSYTGSTALEFTYGRKVDGKDDPVITMVRNIAEIMAKGMTSERMGLLMALPIRQWKPISRDIVILRIAVQLNIFRPGFMVLVLRRRLNVAKI